MSTGSGFVPNVPLWQIRTSGVQPPVGRWTGTGRGVQTRPVGETSPSIRPTRQGESAILQQIEVAAGQHFTEVGLAEVAAHPPHSMAEHVEYQRHHRSWVATDHGDRPVAFLVADLVDGNAHIDEVAVHPSHGRQAIGRALIDHLEAWARHRGLPAITLTTFVEVPWNAPYYLRCGFHRLDDAELRPELARVRQVERSRGLDVRPRTAMIRPV
jgi:GNAT superfamily N-acetyltransferase